jgi:hypothetical protein
VNLLTPAPAATWTSDGPMSSLPSSFCTRVSSESLRALFAAKVSKPFFNVPYPGNKRCYYGAGPSAHLRGPALEFAKSGVVIDLISYGANAQYASNAKHISGNVCKPPEPVGSLAFFVYLRSFLQAPTVYAQQGGLFCSVDLNINNSKQSRQSRPSQRASSANAAVCIVWSNQCSPSKNCPT